MFIQIVQLWNNKLRGLVVMNCIWEEYSKDFVLKNLETDSALLGSWEAVIYRSNGIICKLSRYIYTYIVSGFAKQRIQMDIKVPDIGTYIDLNRNHTYCSHNCTCEE